VTAVPLSGLEEQPFFELGHRTAGRHLEQERFVVLEQRGVREDLAVAFGAERADQRRASTGGRI
jgi:hypothetical protein